MGVDIVVNHGQAVSPFSVAPTPHTVIGSSVTPFRTGSQQTVFERIQEIVALPSGNIVVADAGATTVDIFHPDGQHYKRIVTQGEGPGEATRLVDLHLCGGDSLLVVAHPRPMLFTADGVPARQVTDIVGDIVGVSLSCDRLLLRRRTSQPPVGQIGTLEEAFVWARDGVSRDTAVTIGLIDALTQSFYGGVRSWILPWGAGATFMVDGDHVVTGYARHPELRWYDAAGAIHSILRWSPKPVAITAAERQAYARIRREYHARLTDAAAMSIADLEYPELELLPWASGHKPVFDRLLADDEGRLWVQRFPDGSYGLFDLRLRERQWLRQTWSVFDTTHVWLGDIRLPDRYDLRAVARGRLYGVARGTMDVESVQVYSLAWSAGSLDSGLGDSS